jgi:hypothetical protein
VSTSIAEFLNHLSGHPDVDVDRLGLSSEVQSLLLEAMRALRQDKDPKRFSVLKSQAVTQAQVEFVFPLIDRDGDALEHGGIQWHEHYGILSGAAIGACAGVVSVLLRRLLAKPVRTVSIPHTIRTAGCAHVVAVAVARS